MGLVVLERKDGVSGKFPEEAGALGEAAQDPWMPGSEIWTVFWIAGDHWRFWYSGAALQNYCLGNMTTVVLLKVD